MPAVIIAMITGASLSDNGKAARTGAPGEQNCTDCHGDYTVNSGGGSIAISAPTMVGNQYTPGQTYNMTVTVSRNANGLFGVGIEALTTANQNAGTLNITNAASTQIKSATVSGVSRRNIVHTLNGGSTPSSKAFNFSWTAPASGTGNVMFYFSGVAGDGDGNEGGDYVYAGSQLFTEVTCAAPAAPAAITGSTTLCSGASDTYSVAAVAGATTYTWSLPGGWTGSSTTNSIAVTSGAASGTITCTANNACGSSPATSLAVTGGSSPAQPAAITGNATLCTGVSATYTVPAVAGATTYTWYLPSGWSGTSSTNSITVVGASNSGTISVEANNACGTSTASALAVSGGTMPSQPAAITGSTSLCGGVSGVYSIAAVNGATSYTWTLPSGWSGTSTSTTINATSNGASGNISVVANSACGSSTPAALAVSGAAYTVDATANTILCNGGNNGNAVATPNGGTGPFTYSWSPAGGSSATATNLTAGTYTVTVVDGSGCSVQSSVTITEPAALVANAGSDQSICNSGSTVIGASPASTGGTGPYTYSWSPVGGIAGSTLENPTVTPTTTTTYTLVVTDQNGCDATAMMTVTVGANGVAPIALNNGVLETSLTGTSYEWYFENNYIPGSNTQTYTPTADGIYAVVVYDANGCASVSADFYYSINGISQVNSAAVYSVYPNPANNEFTFLFNHGTENASATLVDVTGRIVLTQNITNGINTINVSSLAKGAYFLITKNGDQTSSTRVFVSH